MYSINFEWKTKEDGSSWKVHLPSLEAWMRANAGEAYCGNCADGNGLTLWFSEEPTEEQKEAVSAHWDELAEEDEQLKIMLDDDREAAVAAAKAGILSKNWDDMVPAERKLIMNQVLSDADKDALLVVYPQ